MDPAAAAAARREAERWMGVAEKLLMARDLEGCKQFVSQALAADPHTPGADDLLAAADSLIAAQRHRLPSGHPDPYAVLGLDPSVPASRDPDVIHSHYRRLSLLLNRSHPDRPCSLAFADAARLVADSWAFLSDPSRKSYLDADLDAAAAAAAAASAAAAAAAAAAAQTHSPPSPEQEQSQPPPPRPTPPPPQPQQPRRSSRQPATPPSKPARAPRSAASNPQPQQPPPAQAQQSQTFWTACPACCHVHQYDRFYEARTLLCPSCRRPFFSAAMPAPPPVVPGTDMYYCSWGFFPLGFPGGPGFAGVANSPPPGAAAAYSQARPVYPMGPYQSYVPWPGGGVEGNVGGGAGSSTPASAAVTTPVKSNWKVGAKKRGRPKGSKNKKNVVIDINEED